MKVLPTTKYVQFKYTFSNHRHDHGGIHGPKCIYYELDLYQDSRSPSFNVNLGAASQRPNMWSSLSKLS